MSLVKRIPIAVARDIAKKYGYDQVVIYARKVGESPDQHGEHMTSYGVTREHCGVAAQIAERFKKLVGWRDQS